MRFNRSLAISSLVLLSVLPAVAQSQREPSRGWVGIVYTTGIGTADRSGMMVFNDYPVIESVEPGSPAERAGLQARDVVIALDAQDLRRNPMPVRGMLEPGRQIVFRYRRNDVLKVSTVVVAPRPSGAVERWVFEMIPPAPTPRQPPRFDPTEATRVRAGTPMSAPERERLDREYSPPLAPMMTLFGTPSIGVLGADLTQLNDDLRNVLEVKGNGVFVINVRMGSPARESGLKSGDVIIRAGRESVQNPGELIRIMRAAGDKELALSVVRKRKAQQIVLRW